MGTVAIVGMTGAGGGTRTHDLLITNQRRWRSSLLGPGERVGDGDPRARGNHGAELLAVGTQGTTTRENGATCWMSLKSRSFRVSTVAPIWRLERAMRQSFTKRKRRRRSNP